MWWKKKKAIFQDLQQQLRSRFLATSVKVQRRCASYLHHKESKLSIRQRKGYFFVFVTLACGACTYILADTLFGEQDTAALTITPMPVPFHRPTTEVPRFSHSDTASMHRFRAIIDSLEKTPEGRATLEKYFAGRPGFLDSFKNAEQNFR
ncbi:hypothetical protein [Chitinophaga sp. YIM B06452]|uniref:hypothetical protein n=1 Tax=Chitinophaga sp. YIM B06452 TaxID=3082158 RepID=UPI0031FE56EB